MLRNFNELTLKNLNKNKKRFIFTSLGIILAMILITILCTFIPTMLNSTLKQIGNKTGNWHVSYKEIDSIDKDKIKANSCVDEVLQYQELGVTEIKNSLIYLSGYDGDIKKFYNINLKEGDFPENNKEIIIDDFILSKINRSLGVGSDITLKIDDIEEQFKIVGIIKADPSNITANAYTKEVFDGVSGLLVKVKEDNNMKESVEYLETLSSEDNVILNDKLNSFFFDTGKNDTYTNLSVIIGSLIIVIMVATIAIIYNSFNISIAQRSKELGILRTLGTTPKQIRRLIRYEAKVITLISVPIGTILGLLIFKALIYFYNNSSISIREILGEPKLDMIISYKAVLIVCLIGVVSVYISAFRPAIKAGSTSPIESIRSNYFIKKEKINKRRGRLLKKVLKIDKLMAYKNIKRNKSRYRTTVISLSISLIIFIGVYSYSNILTKFMPLDDNKSRDIDIVTYIDSENEDDFNKIKNYIKSIDDIEKSYDKINGPSYNIMLTKDKINSELYENMENMNKANSVEYNDKKYVNIEAVSDIYSKEKIEECYKYLEKGIINYNNMEKNNEVLLINNTILWSHEKFQNIKATDLIPGDEIIVNLQGDISVNNIRMENNATSKSNITSWGIRTDSPNLVEDENTVSLKVAGILEKAPFDITMDNRVGIIMTEKTAESILGKVNEKKGVSDIKVESVAIETVLKDKSKVDEISKLIDNKLNEEGINGKVINVVVKNAGEKNMILQIEILMYGFVIIIGVISLINIINTINTNIMLRKREFISLISIGMPMKKVFNMVIIEGMLYGVTASVIGSIIGFSICSFIINICRIPGTERLYTYIYMAMAIGSIITILACVISTIPAIMKIKNINIIDELKVE